MICHSLRHLLPTHKRSELFSQYADGFFKISSASFVSRSSRFKRAISLSSSDWRLPLPGALILPSSNSLASLSHLESVLCPMPRLAAACSHVNSSCSFVYLTALFLNSLSNAFLFLDVFLPFFHLHTRFRQPSSYYVNSLYSYCPLFMLTPNCNPFQFICLRHPLLIEDIRIPASDVYNAHKKDTLKIFPSAYPSGFILSSLPSPSDKRASSRGHPPGKCL